MEISIHILLHQPCSRIVVEQNFLEGTALLRHGLGPILAHAHPMSKPPGGDGNGAAGDHTHRCQYTVRVTVGSIGIVGIGLVGVIQLGGKTPPGQLVKAVVGGLAQHIPVLGADQAAQGIVGVLGGLAGGAVLDAIQLTVPRVDIAKGSGKTSAKLSIRNVTREPSPCPHSFSKWFWSHQGHIGQKKAIIAVSRKLLKMIYILLEKGQYYDPNYAVKATE